MHAILPRLALTLLIVVGFGSTHALATGGAAHRTSRGAEPGRSTSHAAGSARHTSTTSQDQPAQYPSPGYPPYPIVPTAAPRTPIIIYPPYPGYPGPQPPTPRTSRTSPRAAFVTVVQQPRPNMYVRPGGMLTYTIVVANQGDGRASRTRVMMPFDPALVTVVDVRFKRSGDWVSSRHARALELSIGPLADGDEATAIVRLAVLPNALPGAQLAGRLQFAWQDATAGGRGQSNQTMLAVGAEDAWVVHYPLTVNPARGPSGMDHLITGTIFAPGERVSLWYTTAAGQSRAIDTVKADVQGAIDVAFRTTALRPGMYVVVAQGSWTGFTATGQVTVE